jgi:thioredoxin 1
MKARWILLALFVLAGVAFSAEKAVIAKPAPAPKPTLIFFMNPNGSPCQMQDRILLQGKTELDRAVVLRYVKTTVDEDREVFYQYGVRSLPNLILVDAQGKEIHRFAPGIQELEAIFLALKK